MNAHNFGTVHPNSVLNTVPGLCRPPPSIDMLKRRFGEIPAFSAPKSRESSAKQSKICQLHDIYCPPQSNVCRSQILRTETNRNSYKISGGLSYASYFSAKQSETSLQTYISCLKSIPGLQGGDRKLEAKIFLNLSAGLSPAMVNSAVAFPPCLDGEICMPGSLTPDSGCVEIYSDLSRMKNAIPIIQRTPPPWPAEVSFVQHPASGTASPPPYAQQAAPSWER